jgi:transposase-like protein
VSGKPLYDRELFVPQICERLAKGEPLTSICRDLGMDRTTVRNWRREDPEIDRLVQAARDDGYDALADECLEIADTTQEGVELVERGGKKEYHHGDMLGHRKLRIETRLKLLAKWDPKRYGEKQQHELSGELKVKNSAHELTDDELAAIATAGRTGTTDPA